MSNHKQSEAKEQKRQPVTPNQKSYDDSARSESQGIFIRPASPTGPAQIVVGKGSIPLLGRVGGSGVSGIRQSARDIEELRRRYN